jgi:PPM family protein phosphatase
MGGHDAGDVASRLAVNAFLSAVKDNRNADSEDILALGLHIANQTIAQTAAHNPALAEMGTTLTAAIFELENGVPALRWMTVGDSPMWKIDSQGALTRLNADQSLAGQLDAELKAGLITPEDAALDPRRKKSNVLVHALTAGEFDFYNADFQRDSVRLSPGDCILIASDGIETLPEARLGEIARQNAGKSAGHAATAILDAVLAAKAEYQDNVTLTLVRFPSATP